MRRRQSASQMTLILGAVFIWLCFSGSMMWWNWGQEEPKAEPPPSPKPSHKEAKKPLPEPNQQPFSGEAKSSGDKARQVADRFIRAYLSYDAKHPEKKLKEMRPYLSSFMAEGWKAPDQPLGIKEAKVIEVQVKETTENEVAQETGRFYWEVKTETETVFDHGGKEKNWTLYEVVVGQEGGKWVVEEVTPIGDAGAEPLQLGGAEAEEE
ncbi:hypothetical protein GCM10011571_17280 [Marinithermofilum abyssi]|uniref:Uncharacterized protein n=1 Tax=Marinithermofilum abyssi TaxID=1571185 RepID=A0A8J2VHW2_9BACL|nr:hypothetical protein [Marinithermofilum abyssi]GGE16176.1 hypothetical protein GCM10011571_17280 [Marinithermofilum abyssi]